jgi:integrase
LVFPDHTGPRPVRTDRLRQLLVQAEAHAGLTMLSGSLFHAYRRKFASERTHVEAAVVMELMGISDLKIFLECYSHTSTDTVKRALRDRRPNSDLRLERSGRSRAKGSTRSKV